MKLSIFDWIKYIITGDGEAMENVARGLDLSDRILLCIAYYFSETLALIDKII